MTHITPQWMIDQGFPEAFAERFWDKVTKTDYCWVWNGSRHVNGYGLISAGTVAKSFRANRASWMLSNGPIPNGMHVCHRCDNPSCVNPDHLWLGTHLDNMRDCSLKGRKSHFARFGELSNNPKLTTQKVLEIRSRSNESTAKLGFEYGVDRKTIWNVIHYRTWSK